MERLNPKIHESSLTSLRNSQILYESIVSTLRGVCNAWHPRTSGYDVKRCLGGKYEGFIWTRPSVSLYILPVTYYQQLNFLPDFHKFRYRI